MEQHESGLRHARSDGFIGSPKYRRNQTPVSSNAFIGQGGKCRGIQVHAFQDRGLQRRRGHGRFARRGRLEADEDKPFANFQALERVAGFRRVGQHHAPFLVRNQDHGGTVPQAD